MRRSGLRRMHILLAVFACVVVAFYGTRAEAFSPVSSPSLSEIFKAFAPWLIGGLVDLLVFVIIIFLIARKNSFEQEPIKSRFAHWGSILGGVSFAFLFVTALYLPILVRRGGENPWLALIVGVSVLLGVAAVLASVIAYRKESSHGSLWGAALGAPVLGAAASFFLLVKHLSGAEFLYATLVATVTCLIISAALIGLAYPLSYLVLKVFERIPRSFWSLAIADERRTELLSGAIFILVGCGAVAVLGWTEKQEEVILHQENRAITLEISDGSVRALYHLEDTSDSSGNGFHLVNNNKVVFAEGLLGNAADGGQDNAGTFLSIENNLGLTGKSISISAWFKMKGALGDETQQHIAGHSKSNPDPNQTSVGVWKNKGIDKAIAYRINTRDHGFYAEHNLPVKDSNWHHIVNTYENNAATLWFDGQLRSRVDTSGRGAPSAKDFFEILAFNQTDFFEGLVDEVVVFDRVLAESEISNLWNGGVGREVCATAGCGISGEKFLEPPENSVIPQAPALHTVQLPQNSETAFFFPQSGSEIISSPHPTEGILLPDPGHPIVWEYDGYQVEVIGASLGSATVSAPASSTPLVGIIKNNEVYPYGVLTDSEGKPYPVGAVLHAVTLYVNVYNRGPMRDFFPVTLRRLLDESGTLLSPSTSRFDFSDGGMLGLKESTLYPLRRVIFITPPDQKEFTFTSGFPFKIFFSIKQGSEGKLMLEKVSASESPDVIPPSVPTGLEIKNLGAPPWFFLSWRGSTDNVGVVGYRVYRDGVPLIGTASSTTYLDGYGLYPESHFYNVAAFDAAGNISGLSEAKYNYSTESESSSTGPLKNSSCEFSAIPDRIVTPPYPQPVTLSWSCEGAKSGNIYPLGISLGASDFPVGSRTVSPASTTTYIFTATGSETEISKSVQVRVFVYTPGPL